MFNGPPDALGGTHSRGVGGRGRGVPKGANSSAVGPCLGGGVCGMVIDHGRAKARTSGDDWLVTVISIPCPGSVVRNGA